MLSLYKVVMSETEATLVSDGGGAQWIASCVVVSPGKTEALAGPQFNNTNAKDTNEAACLLFLDTDGNEWRLTTANAA